MYTKWGSFHTVQDIDEIKKTLQQKDVKVHIWKKKEIENYAINLDALYRMFVYKFTQRNNNLKIPLSEYDFKEKILLILEEFKLQAQAQIITRKAEKRENKAVDKTTIISEALGKFVKDWEDVEFRLRVISGKDFFTKLNAWLNNEYHISISIDFSFGFLQPEKIDSEIPEVINDFIKLTTL